MKRDRWIALVFSLCIIAVLALNVGVYYQLANKNVPALDNAGLPDSTLTPGSWVKQGPVIKSYYRIFSRMIYESL